MTIGDRLLKLRKEKNLSQEELANELDVSRQTISKWETNQSIPDFDKIVTICKYFGITTDELLTGNKDIVKANADSIKSNYARNIAIAVAMYILSLVLVIIFAAQFNQPIVGISLFFAFVAAATGLLVYNGIYYKKETKKEEPSTEQKTIIKQVTSIVGLIGLIVYLVVSFTTSAWHITWVIFIIIGLINKIIELIFYLKTGEKYSSDDEEDEI